MKIIFILITLLLSNFLLANQTNENKNELQKITLAGGCFWCMEPPYEKQKGIKDVVSGYMGGKKETATYKKTSSGETEHLEVVQITYNPNKIGFKDILEIYWRNINPTDSGGQFVDRGKQYTTAIFYHTEKQKKMAEISKKNLQKSDRFKKEIVTPIREAKAFYKAEKYHQDYYKKNPIRYKFYRLRSGRDQYLEKKWGKDREYKIQGPSS